jgi:RNA polymerase sigma-70 factor (family 1)
LNKCILDQINSKGADGYKYLYDNYYASLCCFSAHFLEHGEEAEDIIQDVFLRLWNSTATFNSIEALTSFLYVSVKNASLNATRNQTKFCHNVEELTYIEAKDKTVVQMIIEEEFYRQIYLELNKLSAERRSIIMLSIEGYSNKEIADKMGISVNTVKTLKLKTYRLLRDFLKPITAFLLSLVNLLWFT